MAAQNIPLPAGWEAKYDPGQRRYFFIDHSTHRTTWEDPRLSMHQPQGPGYQMQASSHHHRHSRSNSPKNSPRQSTENLALLGLNKPKWQKDTSWQQGASRQHHHHSRSNSPRHTPRHSPKPSPRQSTENIAMQELNKPKWQKDVENKFNIQVDTMGHHDDEVEQEDQKDPSETSFTNADAEKVQKLKRMFPTAEEWAIRKALATSNNVEGMAIANLVQNGYKRQNVHAQMKENTIVTKLMKEFPTAEEGVIRDVIQCVDQNEARCIQELKALGYKHSSLHQPTPRQPSPLTKDRQGGSSPAKKATSPTRKTSKLSSPEPEVSASEKNRMKEQLGKEFKDYSSSMIGIALETTKFNEERARKLLQNMAAQREKSTEKRSAQRSLSPTSRTGASTSGTSSSSTVTVTLPDFSLPSITVTSSRSGGKKSSTSVTSTTSATRKPAAARHAPKKPKSHSASPLRSRQVTVQKSDYFSSSRTAAVGPDPSLAAGADKDLLISEYITCNGQNPEYCNGPNPDNEGGLSDYYGADADIRQGPNPSLRCGPNHDLLGGTIYGVKPVFVTTL